MVRAVDNGCRPTLGLEVIAGLLQVESPLSKAALRESLMPRQKLAEVLVSEALLAGHQVGALGLSLLDLHRTRSQYYAFIVDRLPSSPSVLKGSMVARHYPSGVTRGLVDLDLLCRNENEFWRCAAAVQGIMSAHPLMATWPIGERNHFVVAYETPSQGSVFEAPYRIELSTNALPGNFIDMPSREVPWDYSSNHSPAYDLLLLAEEQFQRGVIGRDVVDVVYLLRPWRPRTWPFSTHWLSAPSWSRKSVPCSSILPSSDS